jgi:hypothetical protein
MLMSVLALAAQGCTSFDASGFPTEDSGSPPDDCSNYQYNGFSYNCDQLDRCTETDFQYRLACCECDIALCNVDPSCPVDPNLPPPEPPPSIQATSCMNCHNGSEKEDYGGAGLSNPHPFVASGYLSCVQCHGGNGQGQGKAASHVTAPPEIGDRLQQQNDPYAFFNRLTLTSIDKIGPYADAGGQQYTGLDYLQFINPGDLRVVSQGKSCGSAGCHGGRHAEWVNTSLMATAAGIYSGTLFTSGVPNNNPQYRGWYQDTAAEYGFRAVSDPDFVYTGIPPNIGRVGQLYQFPEKAQFDPGGAIYNNPLYDAYQLANYVYAASTGDQYANQIIPNTPLQDLVAEIVAITCGDCHLGSAGSNNRYADFRSSGCTACHMEYRYDGRSRSLDPNVPRNEPQNPDAIAPGERPHIDSHQIRSVARILQQGGFTRGISDRACVGCHQGSNRTVLQFWGIRLDQNQDVVNNLQYPANPATFANTAQNRALFNPGVGNNTFNGRNANQYLEIEDYDADGRDDTPKDIHHARGMSCIDCHSSRDVHNGTAGDESSGRIWSREDQQITTACESCHGTIQAYSPTVACVDYLGKPAECAADIKGNPIRNVTVDVNGNYWLRGRVDGVNHYLVQTRDVVVNNNKSNPQTGRLLYTPIGSYAMGRADGNPQTGIGPIQGDPNLYTQGFYHSQKMECVSCHSSWTNNCIGCHLAPGYDANPANYFFSNTTGERIVLFQAAADFTYISPIPFFLGVGSRNLITQTAPGMKMFFRYDADLNGNTSNVFAFTDRLGNGNNPNYQNRGAFGALGHNKIMPHSTRGRVDANNEGPRYCVSCHLNTEQINNFGADYAAFYADMANHNPNNLNFALLQQHIGQNTNNAINSPYFVHMVVGLGSGLFFFDANGCPVNPLDSNAYRAYCQGNAPADIFDINNAVYQLDRVVENTGVANASSAHPMFHGQASVYRAGSLDPGMAGPLGGPLLQKLADPNVGLILDGWIDSNGAPRGTAANFAQ